MASTISVPLRKNEKGLAIKYNNFRKQLCPSSKFAVSILLWNCLASYCFHSYFLPAHLKVILSYYSGLSLRFSRVIVYGLFALLLMLFPLAGLAGDIKFGRFKLVTRGLLLVTILTPLMYLFDALSSLLIDLSNVFHSLFHVCQFTSLIGFVAFYANAIPLAMDQLRDAPSGESRVFIYLYVLIDSATYFLRTVVLILNPLKDYNSQSKVMICSFNIAIALVTFFLFLITLCFAYKRRILINVTHTVNPYKLVYKVTAFGFHHKTPLNRSAFTYCEDEQPSRLDLGKEKYGGPFTTEEVENVKVFYGMLKIFCSYGPVFYIHLATNQTSYLLRSLFDTKLSVSFTVFNFSEVSLSSTMLILTEKAIFYEGGLMYLLVAIAILSYLCLFRHSCCRFVQLKILTRLEVGIAIDLINLVFMLGVVIAAHTLKETQVCMFYNTHSLSDVFKPYLATLLIIVQQVLAAFSSAVIQTSFLEFVCAQSPHSMKGMLIGLSYAIKGLFQMMGTIFILFFSFQPTSSPSCGFYYYTANIVIGLVIFAIFSYVAKRYKYRERDEPYRIHQYAEKYYSETLNSPAESM